VYGADDLARCWGLADDLGVALQQTNILRDVREDLINGRIYLPAEDLERYGVTLQIGSDEVLGGPPAELARLVRGDAARASEWYDRGLALLDHLDRRSRACTGAMAGIYVVLNKRLADQPALMTTGRLSLSGREKALVAARALAGRKL
jgi:phytoene synthase